MRALVCSYAAPQFDRDSGSRRLFHLMEMLLETGASVTFIGCTQGAPAYEMALRRRGVYTTDLGRGDAEDVISAAQCDVALLAYWPVAEYFLPLIRKSSPATRVIVDTVDLHFLRNARQTLKQSRPDALPPRLTDGYGSSLAAELNTYAEADLVLTVSSSEARLLDSLLGGVVPSFVVPDCEAPPAESTPSCDRRGIVFLGSFRHTPNIEAVEYLCKEIMPILPKELLAEHPVSIIGDGLNEKVRAYGDGLPSVRMVGWVPDIWPYLERAKVSIAPLRYGAGTQRKVVQSLLAGTPVVTTTIGAGGLELEDERHCLVAEDADSFAGSLERVLTDDALWHQLASAGRERAVARHGRGTAIERLHRCLEVARSQVPKPGRGEPSRELLDRRWANETSAKLESMVATFASPSDRLLVLDDGTGRSSLISPVAPFEVLDLSSRGVHDAEAARSVADELGRPTTEGRFLLVPEWSRRLFELFPGLSALVQTEHEVLADWEGVGVLARLQPSVIDPSGNGHGSPIRAADLEGRLTVRHDDHPESAVPAVRLLAFYLPQYHPIPENDRWWGEGFTDWTNVAKAEPLYEGHYQPHRPGDLGYYDLRLPSVREEQAVLARAYGIHAFCYYHYWFSGKQLLERPFSEVLTSGDPDFPFLLCWANEPWSRRWDGRPHDLLQPQSYSAEDDIQHIRALLPALSDPRAVTIDGKPLLVIYQAKDLPDPAATVDRWKSEVERAGHKGLYLLTVETGWDEGWDATKVGFDGKVLFTPQFSRLLTMPRLDVGGMESLRVYDYAAAVEQFSRSSTASYPTFETVCPGWDNSPRTGGNGVVLHDSAPKVYEDWLRSAVERVAARDPDQRIVFVNAWNEWAEGAHLEPDERHGHGYLEATSRALAGHRGPAQSRSPQGATRA